MDCPMSTMPVITSSGQSPESYHSKCCLSPNSTLVVTIALPCLEHLWIPPDELSPKRPWVPWHNMNCLLNTRDNHHTTWNVSWIPLATVTSQEVNYEDSLSCSQNLLPHHHTWTAYRNIMSEQWRLGSTVHKIIQTCGWSIQKAIQVVR